MLNEPVKHAMLPLTFTGWDDGGEEYTIFYGVTFLADFGVIAKGAKYSSICVAHDKAVLETYNEEGTEVVECVPIKIAPVSAFD